MFLLESLSLKLFPQKYSKLEVPANLKHDFQIEHMRGKNKAIKIDIFAYTLLL